MAYQFQTAAEIERFAGREVRTNPNWYNPWSAGTWMNDAYARGATKAIEAGSVRYLGPVR